MNSRIIKLLFFMAVLTGLGSCKKFLNQTPDSVALSEDQVFTDYTQSQKFVDQLLTPGWYFDDNNVQNVTSPNLNNFFGKQVYGLREKLSDNIIPNQQYNWISGNALRQGNGFQTNGAAPYWNESDYQRFQAFWKAIRAANLSIANVGRIKGATDEQKASILGEAYFLRGHFYFMLLQGWGGMPWITAPLDPSQNMDLPRDTYTVTAQKIATSFDTAAQYLPAVVNDADWGKPSGIAALAYKAKVLLWAAGPYSNPSGDQQLWQNAALACGQAVDAAEKTGYYHLVDLSNWKNLFVDVNAEALHEVLFGRMVNQSFGYGPYYTCPKSVAFGSNPVGCESPTENLAECYAWSNGEPIDPASAEYQSKPFTGDGVTHTGRDPRFNLSIMYNGSVLSAVQKLGRTVEIWNTNSFNGAGASELAITGGNPVAGWTFTGYYNNKLYSDAMPTHGTTYLMWNVIRMADLYLYYAEAANRAWGPTAPPQGIPGFSLTAVASLNKVRTRASMPAYDDSQPWLTVGTADQFEKVVRNETRIETAFEDKRFYDLRRWDLMTDPATTGTMYGLFINRTGGSTFNYSVVTLPNNLQLKWQDRHKLFPINPGDIYLGPNSKQNPGW